MPLGLVWEEQDEARLRRLAPAQIAKTRQQAQVGALVDGAADALLCQGFVEAIAARRELPAREGTVRFVPTAAYDAIVAGLGKEPPAVRPLTMSSNSVVLLGEQLFLKFYRRVREGINPELEIGRFLTDVAHFPHCVPVAGSVELKRRDGNVCTLALLQKFVLNQGDAWAYSVDYLRRHLEAERDTKEHPGGDAHGAYLMFVRRLGQRTAQLHTAFALRSGDPAFDPEPVTEADIRQWAADLRRDTDATLRLVVERAGDIPETLQPRARELLEAAPHVTRYVDRCAAIAPFGQRTRLHGDYHLGQVLVVLDDLMIIDFEGEPSRSVAERRAKHSALRDVAGMLRSFNYARHAAVLEAARTPDEAERLEAVARAWEVLSRAAFLEAYAAAAVTGGLYADRSQFDATLALRDMFELEKAMYELRYELQNRPDWVAVPLAGIAALVVPAT